jgi:hypothetical protein
MQRTDTLCAEAVDLVPLTLKQATTAVCTTIHLYVYGRLILVIWHCFARALQAWHKCDHYQQRLSDEC